VTSFACPSPHLSHPPNQLTPNESGSSAPVFSRTLNSLTPCVSSAWPAFPLVHTTFSEMRPIFYQNSRKFSQKSPTFSPKTPNFPISYLKSPIFCRPTFYQKSTIFFQNSRVFSQKSPTFSPMNPTFPILYLKNNTFCPNSSTCFQDTLI